MIPILVAALVAAPQDPAPAPAEAAPDPQFVALDAPFDGYAYWTEGIAPADVDNDGDLDLFLARGECWNRQGRKQPNGLVVNLLEEGSLTLEDQSARRLGQYESHAKDVVAGDLDGDGFVDALFSNGFNTAPPFLYVNRGAERPGYYRMESDARGFVEVLNSAAADIGDVDDDGDLDVVILDAGPSYLGEPGGRPRLFLNDGAAYFREAPDLMSAPLRVGPMGAHLVDLDGDFDLDLLVPCREDRFARGHTLLANDGTGRFHDPGVELPPTTGAVYEVACNDLDGDDDVDLFFVSLSNTPGEGRWNIGEGAMFNRQEASEDGALTYEIGPAHGVDDDNDVLLLDHDMDGDLDAVIGSLGESEKVLVNDGAGGFTLTPGIVQAIGDRTLDIAAADLDNDGRVDLITAQGESRMGEEQEPGQVFLNRGPVDDRGPVFRGVEAPERLDPGASWVLHANVRDDVDDDGADFVTVTARFSIEQTPPEDGAAPDPDSRFHRGARVTASGGGLHRVEMAWPEGAEAGAALVVFLTATDRVGNVTEHPGLRIPIAERPRRGGRFGPPGGDD